MALSFFFLLWGQSVAKYLWLLQYTHSPFSRRYLRWASVKGPLLREVQLVVERSIGPSVEDLAAVDGTGFGAAGAARG